MRKRKAQDRRPRKLRVLCIDKERPLVEILKDTLELENYTVVTACDGQQGLEKFFMARRAGHPFDAVITELNLPGRNGSDIATKIKQAAPAVRVIMLTAPALCLRAEPAMPPGVDHLLSKPVTADELRAALANSLHRQVNLMKTRGFGVVL